MLTFIFFFLHCPRASWAWFLNGSESCSAGALVTTPNAPERKSGERHPEQPRARMAGERGKGEPRRYRLADATALCSLPLLAACLTLLPAAAATAAPAYPQCPVR